MRQLDAPHGVVTPYEGRAHSGWDPNAPIPAPLWLHSTPVRAEWVDYNQHMSESCYLLVFGDNSDAFFRYFGIDEAHRANGFSFYTVQTQIHYLREAVLNEPLRLSVQLLDVDPKRAHLFHAMHHGDSGALLATAEQMLVHVNMHAQRSAPLPPVLYERLLAIRDAHARLPRPEQAGRPIGIRHSN